MQKIQTFWHVLRRSLVPLDYYYHKLLTTRIGFSMKYFVTLVVFVVFLATVLKSAIFISQYSPKDLATLIQSIESDYPDDLVVSINELGRLTTNDDKPYILFSPLRSNPQALIVIDPKAEKEKQQSKV